MAIRRDLISRFDCDFQVPLFLCAIYTLESAGEYGIRIMDSILAARELEPTISEKGCPRDNFRPGSILLRIAMIRRCATPHGTRVVSEISPLHSLARPLSLCSTQAHSGHRSPSSRFAPLQPSIYLASSMQGQHPLYYQLVTTADGLFFSYLHTPLSLDGVSISAGPGA